MKWDTVMEFIPVPDIFYKMNTMQVSNPLINQFWNEYVDGISVNYAFTYDGYSYDLNMENNCYTSAQYCFYINSPFYTYRHSDEYDYRFPLAGITPFYADYDTSSQRIVFDGVNYWPKLWTKNSEKYKAAGGIKF